MNTKDKKTYDLILGELAEINSQVLALPGLNNERLRDVFIKQVIDSIRRIEYIYRLKDKQISPERCNPQNDMFDPIQASIYKLKEGDVDEAVWLIFLATHYGKHIKHGWLMTRDLYGGLKESNTWTWSRVSRNKMEFDDWYRSNFRLIKGAFGNHRKFESKRPDAPKSFIAVVSSYIDWVGENCSHDDLLKSVADKCDSDSNKMFDYLYNSMNSVVSFGRMARFDFLTMLGKVGVVNIDPDSAYLKGATGPIPGAKLLLSGSASSNLNVPEIEEAFRILNSRMSIGLMGMQVLEDSLCNWQKSPNLYRRFSG